jgi:hypothetical protein
MPIYKIVTTEHLPPLLLVIFHVKYSMCQLNYKAALPSIEFWYFWIISAQFSGRNVGKWWILGETPVNGRVMQPAGRTYSAGCITSERNSLCVCSLRRRDARFLQICRAAGHTVLFINSRTFNLDLKTRIVLF